MSALPWRKLLLLGGAALAIVVLVGLPTLAQDAFDASGELSNAECYGHHKQENFRSMDLFADSLVEVPKGASFTFALTVKNPWLAELRNVVAYVNVSDAPGLALAGASPADEVDAKGEQVPASPRAYASKEYPLTIPPSATEIYASLEGAPYKSPLPSHTPGFLANSSDYRLDVLGPDGKSVAAAPAFDPATPYDPRAKDDHHLHTEARVDAKKLQASGPGAYKLVVYYAGVDPGAFDLFRGVYSNATQELVLQGPAVLKPGEEHTFTFNLTARSVESLQRMRYGGRAISYHEHREEEKIESAGAYDKYATTEFRTGARLVKTGGDASAQGNAVDLLEPTLRRWGQVLGLAGSFLIIPSLVFGGTFGRGSVATLNRWMGTPRRRVLLHNSVSFWLLGIAALHMLVFFYESFWVWSAGLVWGGLALASMIGLGVTGATQRRFVARWGFNRWRYVHFAMGILVVVFAVIHAIADGSHFSAARDAFGGTVPK